MRRVGLLLMLGVLASGCGFVEEFPLSVNDIDTLTAYRHLLDSLAENERNLSMMDSCETEGDDFIVVGDTIRSEASISESWEIVSATFKDKTNAFRYCQKLQSCNLKTELVSRNDFYFVLIAGFNSKDSAECFRVRNSGLLAQDSYVVKADSSQGLMRSNKSGK